MSLSFLIIFKIFSIFGFQGTILTEFLSVIRNLNLFKSLITGKTSYREQHFPAGRVNTTSFPWLIIIYAPFPPCLYLYHKSFRFFSLGIRQPPTLPHRHQCSTIGRLGLNHRVRDGNGCFPQAHRHRKFEFLTRYEFRTNLVLRS